MRKSPAKSKKLYRVQVDYKAAGVDKIYGPKGLVIYERKSGVSQKVKAALDMGVHPKFITIEEVDATWQPSPEYDGLCLACNLPYNSPNEACPQIPVIEKMNAARVRRNQARGNRWGGPDPLLDRPHPEQAFIQELP